MYQEGAMGFRLVDDDLDLSVELSFAPPTREALGIQLQRWACADCYSYFGDRLARKLTDLLDADLQPPSASQLSYALSISKALDVALPSEVLKYKGAMFDFLDRYAPIFKARTGET